MPDFLRTMPEACYRDPYALEEWLTTFPAAERGAVARGIAGYLGHASLERWKEHHAFGVALGRPLQEFPRGTYAFFFCGEEPLPDRDVIAEELAPPDLAALAEEAGLEEEEIEEMDEEELADAIAEELGEERLHEGEDGFFKHAEASSLFELLRIMVAHGDLGIDPDPSPFDARLRDERLDEAHAHLGPIRDLRLRRVASELDGSGWQMERAASFEAAVHCHGILERRPGWCFLCGWTSAPPNESGGACILYRPADGDEDRAVRASQA